MGMTRGAGVTESGATGHNQGCCTLHELPWRWHGGAGYPRIAGLNAIYLAKPLKDYCTGKRNNPVMVPMATNLTEDEISAKKFTVP